MLLKICDENLLFSISHTKYMDILCYCVIVLCVFLCLFIQNKKFYDEITNKLIKKTAIFIASIIFLIFIVLTFILILNSSKFETCSCLIVRPNIISENNKEYKHEIYTISQNKIIIIGDSRMSLIEDDRHRLNIPKNITFIAKGGGAITWYKEIAEPKLKSIINKKNSDYKYHVVFNMGVNDLNHIDNAPMIAEKYYKLYKKLSIKFPEVDFYLLSVNPIDETAIQKIWPQQKRTTREIITFNKFMSRSTKNSNLKNMKYCDSYNNIEFVLPDGLHYDFSTNKHIINYIINKCIEY